MPPIAGSKGSIMPTASQRPPLGHENGASTASNETPVSTAEQPNPPNGANTRASRSPELAANEKQIGMTIQPKPTEKANGRDHPAESEHDHAHQKLKGASAERG
jgi:hypothetical protein